jgi:hypothetical protein
MECVDSVLEGFYFYPSSILTDFQYLLFSIIWNGAVFSCQDSVEGEM